MLLHGCVGAHAVEQLVLLAVLLDDFAPALIVASQHATEHDKVCPRTCQLHDTANQIS